MKKILIIEDDQIVANIYRNKFAVDGYQVEVALDGQSGFDMINSFRPDAVLMDLMLPKLTGVDLMKKLRATADFQQLPVIVFSNTYLTNMVQEAWKAGATKCLSKANCTPKQVIDVVRSTLAPAAPIATGHTVRINGDGNVESPEPANPENGAAASRENKSAASDAADEEFQNDLRQTFVNGLPSAMAGMRAQLQAMIKADNEETRVKQAQELYRRVHGVTGNAAITGLSLLAQLSDALEALLKELHEKPKNMNASTMRTVASGIDFMGRLFDKATLPGKQDLGTCNILVVDDEAISRRAVSYALDKAKLKCVAVEDPAVAFGLLTKNKYDLIFLDVDMPGMNGFELCTRLRALPIHKTTPVVFVTSLNNFESRANSTVSGGNDFIAKPFLFIELAVKALVYILRARLEEAGK
jgi:DNA-binding response OmpR family regulator